MREEYWVEEVEACSCVSELVEVWGVRAAGENDFSIFPEPVTAAEVVAAFVARRPVGLAIFGVYTTSSKGGERACTSIVVAHLSQYRGAASLASLAMRAARPGWWCWSLGFVALRRG